jgi:epoxyqueuosine reductase QueG
VLKLEANEERLKQEIREFASSHGANLIGFAAAARWQEFAEIPEDFWPAALWDKTRTVIVLGVQMPLPIVDTTPSNIHLETYETSNRELDGLAYNLTRYLNSKGHASIFLPRDGYRSLKQLLEKPYAAFSHTFAAKYAGLGTVSCSHNLLTPEFGPRVRLVSVFTAASIEPDQVLEQDLCINCRLCAKCCPAGALDADKAAGSSWYSLDTAACINWHHMLTKKRAYPCGVCTKVCPVGKDRELYQEKGMTRKYLNELTALEQDLNNPEYKSWTHFRSYGSWAIENGRIFGPAKEEEK